MAENRRRLSATLVLPSEPAWLEQVHGTRVIDLDTAPADDRRGDAAVTRRPGVVAAVLTADCLPVVLASANGQVLAVAHAGWRGLADGVLEATVDAMDVAADGIHAWLAPCIGQAAFEVGPEVREEFMVGDPRAAEGFAAGRGDRWLADLQWLARHRLARLGVTQVALTRACTATDPDRYFSYRRDGQCGRMATLAWRRGPPDSR